MNCPGSSGIGVIKHCKQSLKSPVCSSEVRTLRGLEKEASLVPVTGIFPLLLPEAVKPFSQPGRGRGRGCGFPTGPVRLHTAQLQGSAAPVLPSYRTRLLGHPHAAPRVSTSYIDTPFFPSGLAAEKKHKCLN